MFLALMGMQLSKTDRIEQSVLLGGCKVGNVDVTGVCSALCFLEVILRRFLA